MTPRNARRAARWRAGAVSPAEATARAEAVIERCGTRNLYVEPDRVVLLAEDETVPSLILTRAQAADALDDCPRALRHLRETHFGVLVFVLLNPGGVVSTVLLPPAAGVA